MTCRRMPPEESLSRGQPPGDGPGLTCPWCSGPRARSRHPGGTG